MKTSIENMNQPVSNVASTTHGKQNRRRHSKDDKFENAICEKRSTYKCGFDTNSTIVITGHSGSLKSRPHIRYVEVSVLIKAYPGVILEYYDISAI